MPAKRNSLAWQSRCRPIHFTKHARQGEPPSNQQERDMATKTKHDTPPLKTRVIVQAVAGGFVWRAPLIEGRIAHAQLRSMNEYATEISARVAGEKHVKRLFPAIQFE